jgi:AcrR family transcriptional regulator
VAAAECRTLGRPRDPEVERRILDTTLRLLQEDGFSRMTIDAIAEAAGVSKPTIYRRWTSKADIATAALEQVRISEAPVAARTSIGKVKAILANFRRSLLRPNGLALVGTVLAEENHAPDLLTLFRERVVRPRRAMVAAALEEACRNGELRADADVTVLVNLLIGSFYARYLTGEPIPPDWVDRIVDEVCVRP